MTTLTTTAQNLREMLNRVRGLERTQHKPLVRLDYTNLVKNGGFDTDLVGWTDSSEGTGSTTWDASGAISLNNPAASSDEEGISSQSISTAVGLTYILSATKSGSSSVIQVGTGIGNGSISQTSGTADEAVSFRATATTTFITLRNFNQATPALVDNVSLYEADPSDDAPWLRLPYGYSVGRTGMVVRDGVVLHPSDYTEITNGGQTWIKPLVAPGVSTEFSIWGSEA